MRTIGECLPIEDVLNTVRRVEQNVTRFYDLAARQTDSDEVMRLFVTLKAGMKTGTDAFETVCTSLACGSTSVGSEEDLAFLSVLAESAFYGRTATPEQLTQPGLTTSNLVDNALQLERDLLLFYMKFYSSSCADHRPVFQDLINRGQRHISELNNVRRRLKLHL